ncbi:MAG: SAM-dependent DNA methyltransferase [Aquificae bacterium]|nr:SAM-dependent DNA methyltransferase [Aquificota bacterium]
MITADHLRKEERINLGSYYTSQDIVRIVWDWIRPLIDSKTVIFDPACGYGYLGRRPYVLYTQGYKCS